MGDCWWRWLFKPCATTQACGQLRMSAATTGRSETPSAESSTATPSSEKTSTPPLQVSPRKRMEPLEEQKLRMLYAVLCSMALGIAHPFFTELSKSAHLYEFEGGVLVRDTRRVMPFHLITLTLTSQTLAVLIAACTRVYQCGSWQVASRELLDGSRFLEVLPIGILYGWGDFLQTMACNKSSTPVVLLVGQCKLFVSALLSKFFLASHSNATNWTRLLTISFATMASTDISASGAAVHSEEVIGACLALLKACLSSTGAVLSERVYKGAGESKANFWVVSFRVQLSMLMTSIFLLLSNADYTGIWATGLFSGGPYLPCTDGLRPVGCEDYSCTCSTAVGWDYTTCLAMLAIILNGYATGFFLKHLSAVCKAVCNVGSSGLCCAACWIFGFGSCSVGQVCVTSIVLLHSGEYAVEKARASSSDKPPAKVIDAEWAASYKEYKGSSGALKGASGVPKLDP